VDAPGWVAHADGTTSPLALAQSPRLEVGHTYVVALVGGPCHADADGATWELLGSGAVLPADGDRIGDGESEGHEVAGDIDQTTPGSLERELLGTSPDDVADELQRAAASAPPHDGDTPSCG
jgi:hypothetical protein